MRVIYMNVCAMCMNENIEIWACWVGKSAAPLRLYSNGANACAATAAFGLERNAGTSAEFIYITCVCECVCWLPAKRTM